MTCKIESLQRDFPVQTFAASNGKLIADMGDAKPKALHKYSL